MAKDYYTQHAVGWHWYEDPPELPADHLSAPAAALDPIAQMSAVRKTIQRALDHAILTPTPQTIERYIILQNQLNARAEQFSRLWQHVLLQQPALNYSLAHPTNSAALQVYHAQTAQADDQVLNSMAKRLGLFFFYRSTCPYCQRFAPMVKHFATRYGLTVIPITRDGIALPEFPDSRPDTGQAAKFHVTVEPSLFAVNPTTQQAYPVAYGLTSETELRASLARIATRMTTPASGAAS